MQWIKSWGFPILLVAAIQVWGSQGLLTDSEAPNIQGHLVEGQPYPGLLSENKPTLVYFWGSWCGICKAMEGTIGRVARDHRVVTVALRSGTSAEVMAFMRLQGWNVPTLADPEGQWAERFGVRGVPALFFVDKAGRIRSAATGFTFEPSIRARLWLLERPQ